ncbi:substrate-binding domain-containing protein [Niveispirillum cyanobacteriorum]|uniref:Phosphate ABC transporter substrate-binding protein n=1 Tax=Niveispirillum cyanobacteriorum TaxID=1612173 RepID=A0A2K9NAX3_9PROT|nr:substrate-binding domain-containing protein [Niveispirillum cyanobacteriorum]AUN30229.1 phosphate ABC transporter substrate-binding protein [Niveispirillum cyanobacteriorum]GGE56649.1 phosphate ABC transporter substrate-binding protein [Niveispirillum cyanobacteriorum]
MTTKKLVLAAVLGAVSFVGLAGAAAARDQIRIVGSSTVFPFTSTVVERFGQTTKFGAPILESTGTGGGMKLFCSGIGADFPDATGASRAMKASEYDTCQKNGVEQITELVIGYDGLTFTQSKKGNQISITKAQLFAALAKEVEVNGQIVRNPHKTWKDVDASLPAIEIEVLGPPPTSGTRDAWVELVMESGCKEFPAIKALDATRHAAVCKTMREDGAFIEAGENDNVIVQRLIANPNAFGIFGYSFLEENLDKLHGVPVNGIEPKYETIASGQYPVSRPLFVYFKNQHFGVIPGLKEFLGEYASERAMGDDGYLADKGLVPLPADKRKASEQAALKLTPMAKPAS